MWERLDVGRRNLALCTIAYIVSSTGSVLLNIVLATTVYRKTGSSVLTASFLALQWLPVLVVILWKSDWEDGADPRQRWIRLDLLSAILTCPLLFLAEDNYLALLGVLFVRGLVDHVNRIIRTVAARYVFPKEKASYYAGILQTGYHIGIGLAALVGVTAITRLTLRSVVLLDIGTFVVAAACVAGVKTLVKPESFVPAERVPLKERYKGFVRAIGSDRRLFFCAMIPPLTSTFFQGTYSVLQPIFPRERLGLDTDAVTVAYALGSAAIVAGSSLFSWVNGKAGFFSGSFGYPRRLIIGISGGAALLYYICATSSHPAGCAATFTCTILCYEVLYMFGYTGIVAYAPQGQLGSVFGIIFAIGCCTASLCVGMTGMLLDLTHHHYGLVVGCFMCLYLALLAGVQLLYNGLHGSAEPAVEAG